MHYENNVWSNPNYYGNINGHRGLSRARDDSGAPQGRRLRFGGSKSEQHRLWFSRLANLVWSFCRETSMHGFNHIAKKGRHPLERVLWAAVTACAIWGAADISLGQWRRYNENPTVVTLEKDFRNWRFTFPALTVCSPNKLDPDKAGAVIKDLWKVSDKDERYAYYYKFVGMVANSELTRLGAFQEYVGAKDLDVDLYKLAVDVMPDFNVKQVWVDNLDPKWLPTMTEAGACYTVNSLAIADIVIVPPKDPDPTKLPIECKYSSHSCYITIEIQQVCIKVFVHSAYDIMDVTDSGLELCPGTQRKLELSVLESGCGRGVRELAVRRRGCLYTDEPIVKGRKVYSMNLCRRSCRNKLAIKLCGCKPFFNFYDEGKPCSVEGMACLSKYANDLRTFTNSTHQTTHSHTAPEPLIKCTCSPQCQDAVYQESSRGDQSWVKGPFAARGSARYSVQAPRTRFSREIVFHFQDLVVSFGGAAGLFLGASFLSFVEIMYFVLERLLGLCKRARTPTVPAPPRHVEKKTTNSKSTNIGVERRPSRDRLLPLAWLSEERHHRPYIHNALLQYQATITY